MTVALLLGLAAGAGMWLIATALRPAPAPLATVLADLATPAPLDDTLDADGSAIALLGRLGIDPGRVRRDLALAGRPPELWARDKLLGAVAGLGMPLTVWAILAALGIGLPPVVAVLAVGCGAVGFLWPDLRLKEQVAQRRAGFQYALSAYLDLVNIILAGGGGIETALVAAAEAGDGWAFDELRRALHTAQRINQPLWTAFDDLGATLGVPELRELASSLGLAGSQGARIRASLAVKADTLRSRQIAQTEAAAEATTERMNVPTAVLLLGFLLFIVFPAVTVISGTGTQTCDPTTVAVACPTNPTDTTVRSTP